jgi:hypothetical protein
LLKAKQSAFQEATNKVKEEFELELKSSKDAANEEKGRSKKLTEQVSELMKELREARRQREDDKLELEKKLSESEGKIRIEVIKKVEAEQELKTREKDKVIADLQKKLTEAKRTAEQGSQQTQGEVLELEIETLLSREFPTDKIEEVKKGVRGADVIQTVIDRRGRECGIILWESKNAAWSNTWIPKLKTDAREAKAHLPVLVATNPPDDIKTFAYREGVWIVTRQMITALATSLRYNLVALHDAKLKNVGRQEKSEIIYQYITSHEFRGRIEAIVEAFSGMQEVIEKEKRWFNSKWSKQEKQIRSVIDNTQGMYYDMQGIMGKALPGLQSLEIEG